MRPADRVLACVSWGVIAGAVALGPALAQPSSKPMALPRLSDPAVHGRPVSRVQFTLPAPSTPETAPAAPVANSGIGRLMFLDRPARSRDSYLTERAHKIAVLADSECARSEAYTWTLAATDQARVNAIVSATDQALRIRGYETKPVAVELQNSMVVHAASANGMEKDANLLAIWSVEPAALNLVLCTVESHG